MSVRRRQEASKRCRKEIGERALGGSLSQANISAYMLAGIGVGVMLINSFMARDGIGAAGLACQTGAGLLLTPDLLRPLGKFAYLQRPLSAIRAQCRGFAVRGTPVLAVALALLGMRVLDLFGFGSNTDLVGVLVFLVMLIGFLYAVPVLAIWSLESIFEGAAETGFREALRQLDPSRTREIRLAIAALLFILGTLLLYADSYL